MLRDIWSLLSAVFRKPHPLDMAGMKPPPGTVAIQIDYLPAGADLAIEVLDGCLRFQAIKQDGTKSEWSGWFRNDGEPIHLFWDAFWDES